MSVTSYLQPAPRRLLCALVAALAVSVGPGLTPSAPAHAETVVGGATMLPSRTIPENASLANNLTTLVAALKAAGLVDTLAGKGPFTVFAPTNAAFERLPDGTVETLLKPRNKKKLTKILTGHVVAGDVSSKDLLRLIKDGHGHARLTTLSGDRIVARARRGTITLTDESGGVARVRIADVRQSNGVVHVIDAVLLPK